MEITRKDNEIIIKLSEDFDDAYLQDLIDYIEFKEIVSKSKASQKQIEGLSEEVKSDWWKKNKSKFIS